MAAVFAFLFTWASATAVSTADLAAHGAAALASSSAEPALGGGGAGLLLHKARGEGTEPPRQTGGGTAQLLTMGPTFATGACTESQPLCLGGGGRTKARHSALTGMLGLTTTPAALLTWAGGITAPLLVGAEGITAPLQVGAEGITAPLLVGAEGITAPLQVGAEGITAPLLVGAEGITAPLPAIGAERITAPSPVGAEGITVPLPGITVPLPAIGAEGFTAPLPAIGAEGFTAPFGAGGRVPAPAFAFVRLAINSLAFCTALGTSVVSGRNGLKSSRFTLLPTLISGGEVALAPSSKESAV